MKYINKTEIDPELFRIKGALAKLLAQEDIHVEHLDVKTAYFNVETRHLALPLWQGMTPDIYDMLVAHETGHAKYTPNTDWTDILRKYKEKYKDNLPKQGDALEIIHGFFNVVEDARIEKLQIRRFPGLKSIFVSAYKDLESRNFLYESTEDYNELTFIDRFNIHFKLGIAAQVKFKNQEELDMIKEGENLETFDQVISLSEKIIDYQIRTNDWGIDDGITIELTIPENKEKIECDGSVPVIVNPDKKEEEDEEEQPTQKQAAPAEFIEEKFQENRSNVVSVLKAPKTAKTLEKKITEEFVDYTYYSRPVKTTVGLNDYTSKIKSVVDDYKIILNDIQSVSSKFIVDAEPNILWNKPKPVNQIKIWENAQGRYANFMRQDSDRVTNMINRFLQKQAADRYSKTRVAKSGSLNMKKIHAYKFKDDLFKKYLVVPEGKNHGFVMFIDFSSSMFNTIGNVVKQVLSLTAFCRKMSIPFDVYLFRHTIAQTYRDCNSSTEYEEYDLGEMEIQNNFRERYILQSCGSGFINLKLRNVLSSRMTAAQFNKAGSYLLWLATGNDLFKIDYMTGTPLIATEVFSEYIVKDFIKKNKIQIMNTIFLTDGESEYARIAKLDENFPGFDQCEFYLRDPKTKIEYYLGGNGSATAKAQAALLRKLKDNTGTNITGFHFTEGWDLKRVIENFLMRDDYEDPKYNDIWDKEKFIGFDNVAGYDKFYLMSPQLIEQSSNFIPKGIRTMDQLQNAVNDGHALRKSSKKLMNQIIDFIAEKQ